MFRKDEVTSRVRVAGLPNESSNAVTLVQTAVRPDGKERTITQKVPVKDTILLARLVAEVTPGAEIEATIITEWRKNGYTIYLAGFCPLAATFENSESQQTQLVLAKAS